jgi:hypothetical protein
MLCAVYARIGLDKYSQDMATIVKKNNFLSGVPTGSNVDGSINGRRFQSFNSNGGIIEDF